MGLEVQIFQALVLENPPNPSHGKVVVSIAFFIVEANGQISWTFSPSSFKTKNSNATELKIKLNVLKSQSRNGPRQIEQQIYAWLSEAHATQDQRPAAWRVKTNDTQNRRWVSTGCFYIHIENTKWHTWIQVLLSTFCLISSQIFSLHVESQIVSMVNDVASILLQSLCLQLAEWEMYNAESNREVKCRMFDLEDWTCTFHCRQNASRRYRKSRMWCQGERTSKRRWDECHLLKAGRNRKSKLSRNVAEFVASSAHLQH